jgi:hypothetical protein
MIEKMISIFDDYREYFGLDGLECRDKQCEFEDKFNEFICEHRGHDLGPDLCGIPEHDFCLRCHKSPSELGFRRGDNWEQDGKYIKEKK